MNHRALNDLRNFVSHHPQDFFDLRSWKTCVMGQYWQALDQFPSQSIFTAVGGIELGQSYFDLTHEQVRWIAAPAAYNNLSPYTSKSEILEHIDDVLHGAADLPRKWEEQYRVYQAAVALLSADESVRAVLQTV